MSDDEDSMAFRILMYSYFFPPQYSGAAKQAVSLAKQLRLRGHYIEFVTVRWPGLDEKCTYEGFPVYRLEAGTGVKHRELRLWWNLFRFVYHRKNDFDIFHSHGAYYANSIIGPLSRLAGWRSVVKASLLKNDLYGIKSSVSGYLHYGFLRTIDAYIAVSRELEREFIQSGLPLNKIHYMPNAVDTERFYPASPEEKKTLRRRLGLPEDKVISLTVGVFDSRKNIGWLMQEWARNNAFETGSVLLAIGPQSREDKDGVFLNSLKRLVCDNPGILCLKEHVDDVELYFRAADLFILPSYGEGMPNVVLEAMASGTPCITTKVSGTQELIQEARNGYTFSLDDAKTLGDAVENALKDKEGLMGYYARKAIEENFSISELAKQYEGLYQKLINTR